MNILLCLGKGFHIENSDNGLLDPFLGSAKSDGTSLLLPRAISYAFLGAFVRVLKPEILRCISSCLHDTAATVRVDEK